MKFGFLLRFQEVAQPIILDEYTDKSCICVEQEKPNEEFCIPLAATRTFTHQGPSSDNDDDRGSHVLNVLPR